MGLSVSACMVEFFPITPLCRQDTCRHKKIQKIRKVKLSGISKVLASSIYSGVWIPQTQSSVQLSLFYHYKCSLSIW